MTAGLPAQEVVSWHAHGTWRRKPVTPTGPGDVACRPVRRGANENWVSARLPKEWDALAGNCVRSI